MAKNLTQYQTIEARETLGLNRDPVALNVAQPREAVPSAADLTVAAQNVPAEKPSLWETTKSAGRVANTTYGLLQTESEFPIDPEFDAKSYVRVPEVAARLDDMKSADLTDVGEQLGQAVSAEHAEERLKKMERDFADEQLLTDAGIKALIPILGVSLLDPVDMMATLATLPVSGGVSAAYKLGRTGRIINGALTAGVATGTTEAVLVRNSVFRDETDVAFAALAGVVLGGALSSLSRSDNALIQSIADDLAKGEIDAAAKSLGIDSAGAKRVAYGSDGEKSPNLAPRATKTADEHLNDIEDPKFRFKGFNWLLQNFQSKLFHSGSPRVRKLASGMLEGGFLKDKKATRGFTAEGRGQHIRRVFEAGVFRETLEPFKAWAKRNGHSDARRLFTTTTGEEFYSEVGKAMRGITDGLSPEALQAAKSIRPFMDNIFELAERAGVKGFNKEALQDYFPRMLSHRKWHAMHRKVGKKGLEKYYREAIVSANSDLGDELAGQIARAYVRTIRQSVAGIENDLLHGIRLDDTEKLRELFDGDPDIENIISAIDEIKLKENANRGTVSHAKSRILFDESFKAPVKGFDDQEFELKFTDLLENDARRVLKRYGQTMSGHIGMAQELGIRSRSDFNQMKAAIIAEAEEAGTDLARAKLEVEALEDAYKLVLGQSIETNPSGFASQASRTATGYTYSTRGGQFGVNAVAEMGNTIGLGSVRSLLRSVPELKKFWTRAKDGQLEHDMARTAELLFAPGVHTLTGHAIRNLDELGEGFEGTGAANKAMAAADPYLKSGARFTAIASGLSGVTDVTQRISAVQWLEKLSAFANGRNISAGQASRLRAAGLTPEMQERVFAMLRESGAGVYRKGRMVDIDVNKWTDGDALDAMNMASHREMRNAIQENDISNATKLFHHPVGRIMLQFLRFPMEAVNKQLLRGVHHADVETAKSWTASYLIGSVVYMAQTSIEFANDPEEREKRLAVENIAKVGFMRTGFSSMLPMAADNVNALAGNDPWFAYGRSSGLGTNVTTSNPVVTTAKDAALTATLPLRLLRDDYQFSQQDVRRATSIIPFQRLLGIKNGLHAIEEQFPEKSKID